MQCQNNEKQLALAVHNYANSQGGKSLGLPPGTVANPSLPPDRRLGLFVPLLPFLEGGELYKSLDRSQGVEAAANRDAGLKRLKLFHCPGQAEPPNGEGPGLTSYVGVAGVGSDAPFLDVTDPKCGVFGYDRRVRFADVKDGLSQTLLFLETADANGPWLAGGAATVRPVDPGRRPYVGESGAFGGGHRPKNEWRFASVPVVANAAMADGSVRTLTASVSDQTLEALATMAGGDQPGTDF